MDDKQLHEIEVRADAATPGLALDRNEDGTLSLRVEMEGRRDTPVATLRFPEDAVFLREGPADVAVLVAEVRRLRKLLRATLPYLRNHDDRGPLGEGWQSDELRGLIEQVEGVG